MKITTSLYGPYETTILGWREDHETAEFHDSEMGCAWFATLELAQAWGAERVSAVAAADDDWNAVAVIEHGALRMRSHLCADGTVNWPSLSVATH